MTSSSWLNFGRPTPPERGSAAGRKFSAPSYYSQLAVFASLWALFYRTSSFCKASTQIIFFGDYFLILNKCCQNWENVEGSEELRILSTPMGICITYAHPFLPCSVHLILHCCYNFPFKIRINLTNGDLRTTRNTQMHIQTRRAHIRKWVVPNRGLRVHLAEYEYK